MTYKNVALSSIILSASMIPAIQAQSPVAVGDEFQVNAYTTGDQTAPAVGSGSLGGFVVVWQSTGSDDGDGDGTSIRGRRFASDGNALGEAFQVNAYTTDDQTVPAISMGPNGDFVVAWESAGSDDDPATRSIQARRFHSDGTANGDQFVVNSHTTGDQSAPAVAGDGTGSFVVVWHSLDSGNGDSSDESVEGRRFDSAGIPSGESFLINTFTTGLQTFPAVGVDGDGDFVVAWNSGQSAQGDSFYSVERRRFSSSGLAVGGQFRVNTYTTGYQTSPAISMQSDGDFLVVWDSSQGGGNGDGIRGQHFAADNRTVGDEFQISTSTTGDQLAPAVARNTDGDLIVTWQSQGSAGDDVDAFSIQGQLLLATGDLAGSEFQVNGSTTGDQVAPAVAAGVDGAFVLVWQSAGSSGDDGDGQSIQARRFQITGAVGDRVWEDQDEDGVQDAGEPGVEGVEVDLYDDLAVLVDSTTTDDQGDFLFTDVLPGSYSLDVELPALYQAFTVSDATSDDLDSDADQAGETATFLVEPGVVRRDQDAGLIPRRVGDLVWNDLNQNGLFDGGEPGIAGVTVTLREPGGAEVGQTQTDAEGRFAFDVLPGAYFLDFTLQGSYIFTAKDQGMDEGLDSDADPSSGETDVFIVTLTDLGRDAGGIARPRVGDRVWIDSQPNGIQDAGEVGADGIEVRIYSGAMVVDSTSTAGGGLFSFTVDPGTYHLELGCSSDSYTFQDQGEDDAVDSDVDPVSGATDEFTMALGDEDLSRDVGLLDPDGDGIACSDLCFGNNLTGDSDGDGLCSDRDCDDADATNACAIFSDGFESGNTAAWSFHNW